LSLDPDPQTYWIRIYPDMYCGGSLLQSLLYIARVWGDVSKMWFRYSILTLYFADPGKISEDLDVTDLEDGLEGIR
jgi:hypothetical protein